MIEILSDSAGRGRIENRNQYVLTEAVKELLKTYNAVPLLIQFYNCASDLAEKKRKDQARLLFSLLAEATIQSFPELCGKSHYKLALLAGVRKEALRHLTMCLQLYPDHRAAQKLLGELSKRAAKGTARV
jgi:hypothetical protein